MNTHAWGLALALAAGAAAGFGGEDPPAPREVDRAIENGLKWLAEHQVAEGPAAGSWECVEYRAAAASLAGLAFLANGHRPGDGPYGAVLERSMRYVRETMRPDGYLGASDGTMYVHAMCTLFGLSYLGRSEKDEGEKELAEWCRKAVNLVVEAQKVRKGAYARGGWKYRPDDPDSDLSVTTWMLTVLHAARQCGYAIDPAVFDAGLAYVNRSFVENEQGEAGFRYSQHNFEPKSPAVSGAAVFVKVLLEQTVDERAKKALKHLEGFPPQWGGRTYKNYFYFGTFYLALGQFQAGDEAWARYAGPLKRLLVDHQEGDGRWALPPQTPVHARNAGPAYPTAMAILILSLEKQYLPMYQRQMRLF
ncbi:MAG: hypothetical protein M5U26_30170 [Planctomycetota bacterium]|nr:hypothetical protein [Planctomycetota bacterium]